MTDEEGGPKDSKIPAFAQDFSSDVRRRVSEFESRKAVGAFLVLSATIRDYSREPAELPWCLLQLSGELVETSKGVARLYSLT